MLKMSVVFSWLFFLFLPHYGSPQEGLIYEYGADNFKQQIEDMDGNFIMFYAPWCRHCTDFHPIWKELAEMINTKDSKFCIAQVDCTIHAKLCHDNDITGYPTLLYFHKNVFTPIEYRRTRDLLSLTRFLSEVFIVEPEGNKEEVKFYSGMATLTDHNIEKFVSEGQHFIMFYVPWCRESQRVAPIWAELAVQYTHNEYIQIGKVDCVQNEMTCNNFDIKQYPYLVWIVNGRIMGIADQEGSLEDLKLFVERMLLTENHDPEKFMKKKKAYPVARISEDSFETFLEKDLVFINYFAPWCAYCMQLNPLWVKLGEKFQNESRVLIADVDCLRSRYICDMEKIKSLPTLILYKQKKVVFVEHGGRPLESLISLVTEQLESKAVNDDAFVEDKQPKDEL